MSAGNIKYLMEKRLSYDVRSLLSAASETAYRLGMKIFLVGGLVRDVIIDRASMDVDLVVEGNAIEFTRALNFDVARVIFHQRFGTVKITWRNLDIDIATARSEYYPEPGALPVVKFSTISEDLFRRDFTINAMAVSLEVGSYGELIDPFYGLDDLHKGLIRVLHERSFIDDATRMWRAVRYEQRLNFHIEPTTLNLLKNCLDYLSRISNDRIRHELELVLGEEVPENILMRAANLGLLTKVHPDLIVDEWLCQKFREIRCSSLTSNWLVPVYLACMFYRLKQDEVLKITEYLHFPKRVKNTILQVHFLKEKFEQMDDEQLKPSDVYFMLREFSIPVLICHKILTNSDRIKSHINNYLLTYRHIRTSLNGEDIKNMGIKEGVTIKYLLENLLKERLNGNIKSRDEEISFIKKWLNG